MFELLASEPRLLIQVMVAWTVCLAAIAWGGGPERAVALTWLIVFEIGWRALPSVLDLGFTVTGVDFWRMSCEVTAGLVLIGVALHANRNYTMWIAAMQVLAMTAHLARGLVEAISPVAYVTMIAVPGWVQLLVLTVGLGRHIVRNRRFGEYRDWRTSKVSAAFAAKADRLQAGLGLHQAPEPSWRDDLK